MEVILAVILPAILKIIETVIATETIIHVVKAVSAWIAGMKDDIGKTPAYDIKTATAEETSKKSELLTKKKNEFVNSCRKFENNLQTAMDSVFDKLIESVNAISKDTGIPINIEPLKRDFKANKKELKNNISKIVNSRIALSDPEFAGILKLKPGSRRSQMIDKFCRKIVREGFKKSEEVFSVVINKALSRVKERIDEKILEKEKSESQELVVLKAMKLEKTKKEFTAKEKRFKQERVILDNFIRVLDKTAS